MTSGTSTYIEANGLRLHAVEWGAASAPPIVLLHGLRAYAHWFDEFAEAVDKDYRVIALDQRGRGASAWAADGRYTTDAYVADLEGVVASLGLKRFALAGHSMGGTNAMHYAARHPDQVSALIVIDSAPEINLLGVQRIRRELAETPKSFASPDEARAFLRRLHARPSEQNLRTRLQWMLKEEGGKLVWRLDGAIFDPKLTPDPPERLWSALGKIACPTLIVRGAESDIVTVEVVQRMLQAIPGSRWVEISAAGHMIVEDNPAGFNRAVTEFLRSARA
jgi:esterase